MSSIQLKQQMDALLEKGLAEQVYPGAVLLISQERNILYFNAVGRASLESDKEVMRLDTLYDLASLTKVLATVPALMRLLEKGVLQLDTPLCHLLPDFCTTREEKRSITIRNLLSHSSGFEAWCPFYLNILENRIPFGSQAKEYIYRLICDLPLVGFPGDRSLYSDLNFILLGILLEKLSGVPLDEFCYAQIYQPLGMSKTFFSSQLKQNMMSLPIAATEYSEWRGGVIKGEVHDENALVMGGSAGHAGLFSTAEDVFLLCQSIILSLKNNQGFWPREMMKQFVLKQNLPGGSTWALGWDTPSLIGSTSGNLFSPNSIGHTGFTGTSIWIDLPSELTVIFLTNRIHPSRANEKIRTFRPLLHNTIREIMS